jgi:hypothetical protein
MKGVKTKSSEVCSRKGGDELREVKIEMYDEVFSLQSVQKFFLQHVYHASHTFGRGGRENGG